MLEEARRLGFLGPGPVDRHLAHAEGFAAGVDHPPANALDLGSGGGLPGLVLAGRWPASSWVLLDANERRTAFLGDAVRRLGMEGRVAVLRLRAEDAGRRPDYRARFDVVTARGFGPPPVVVECAAPLLHPGGTLVVSEPPDGGRHRWPDDGVRQVGLSPATTFRRAHSTFVRLVQEQPCPAAFPRRVGVPSKRPLF